MTSKTSRQVVEEWMAALGSHGIRDAFERYAREDYIQHNPKARPGREGAIAYLEAELAQGGRASLERIVSEGEYVCLHLHMTFADGSPDLAIIDIFRVEDGRIAEHWDVAREVPKVCTNPMF